MELTSQAVDIGQEPSFSPEMLYAFWNARWFIAALTLIGLLAGLAVALSMTFASSGEIEIRPPASTVAPAYLELKAAVSELDRQVGEALASTIKDKENANAPDMAILAEGEGLKLSQVDFLTYFIEDLQSYETLKQGLKSSSAIDVSGLDDSASDQLFLERAQAIHIVPPNEKRNIPNWSVQFKTGNPVGYVDALRHALEASNENVRKKVRSEISEAIEFLDNLRRNQLSDISFRRRNLISNYHDNIKYSLARLGEEAAIAKRLGIRTGTLEGQTFNANSAVITTVDPQDRPYLRGYEALEKEIALIESRQNDELYVPGLPELNQSERLLGNVLPVERARTALAQSPLTQGPFQAASYTISMADVKQNFVSKLVPVAAALFAAAFALVLVAARHQIGLAKNARSRFV